MKQKKGSGLSQIQVIAGGFFIIILIGTLLLCLPIAARGEAAGLLPALFTATSTTCVTGLIVADTYRNWSLFGQAVILLLIQTGGLGFVTIGVFFSIYIRRTIGLRERTLLQESINTLQLAGVVRLTKRIVKGTFLIEAAGAVLLSIRFIPRYGWLRGCYYGIFHSVSAFCNAGFDLLGEKEAYASLTQYADDPLVNITVMALIIIGGIGFVVWQDIWENGIHFRKYLLHTKIVLLVTMALIFGGALLFWLFERKLLFAGMPLREQILASLFSSVTARTAGFNTVDTGALSGAGKLLTMILMFIGGSPGSTAGGIKTTTVAVLILYTWNSLRGSGGCSVFGRRVPDEIIKKACMVLFLNLFLALCAGIILCVCNPQLAVEDIMFEVCSAIGTVGMTTGITRELDSISKGILILLMYCGRIGSMTFALSFIHKKKVEPVQYPFGRITVG